MWREILSELNGTLFYRKNIDRYVCLNDFYGTMFGRLLRVDAIRTNIQAAPGRTATFHASRFVVAVRGGCRPAEAAGNSYYVITKRPATVIIM